MIGARKAGVSACAICLGILLVGIGCGKHGGNRGAIGGEVKLDGKPIERGLIQFAPMEGTRGDSTSGEIAGGRYQLSRHTGPAVGWNRVEIHATRKTGRMIPKPFPLQGKTMEEQVEAVSPRFNSHSTLKVEIKPGDNTADFTVESK